LMTKPAGGAEMPRRIVPGSTPDHPILFICLTHPCSTVPGGTHIRIVPRILTPFPDVSMDLVQAPRVRRKLADPDRPSKPCADIIIRICIGAVEVSAARN
jgi:hypothetical protein